MKKETKNIFDLDKIEDLPKGILKDLRYVKRGLSENTIALIRLFDMKPKLSINEIIVGLYRTAKIEKDRNWVIGTIYNLIRKKVLVKNPEGTYEKVINKNA